MQQYIHKRIATLDIAVPIWERFFTVAPLVLIGTRGRNGTYDLAPKHLAMPLGWENYFGFVCTPRHRTYQNAVREGAFTVSYARPTQVVMASLAAAPRCGDDDKPGLTALPTFRAGKVDGVFARDGYVFLECELERVVEGFGDNGLLAGRIVAAHADEDLLRTSEGDDQDLIHAAPLMAYLYPGRIATIDRTFSFPFPAGFRR